MITTEIAANFFHYGQSLIVLEILNDQEFIKHEELNFKIFLEQNGYNMSSLDENLLTIHNYGKIIGSTSLQLTADINSDKYYWENIVNFREFLISHNLDPERVGLRASEIMKKNKASYQNGYN